MALNLSVPATTSALPKEIETNPKRARAWIEALPLTKTVDSGRQVLATLVALNRGKMNAEDRVALFEIYRPVVHVLLDELDAVYAYASLPLQIKQREAFDLSRQLLTESALTFCRRRLIR